MNVSLQPQTEWATQVPRIVSRSSPTLSFCYSGHLNAKKVPERRTNLQELVSDAAPAWVSSRASELVEARDSAPFTRVRDGWDVASICLDPIVLRAGCLRLAHCMLHPCCLLMPSW